MDLAYDKTGSLYRDKAGNPELVSSGNQDINDPHLRGHWDATAAPSAMLMAAAAAPDTWVPILTRMEKINSAGNPLYVTGLGWMEGVHVRGELTGTVVPSIVSLNHGMIALSLFQALSDDGLGVSGRAIWNDPTVRTKLNLYFQLFEKKAAATPAIPPKRR